MREYSSFHQYLLPLIAMSDSIYQKLIVWQEAHALCLMIYALTADYPKREWYGLVAQMRRSSASVPTNIAEGNGKRKKPQKLHFMEIAETSLDELDYQLLLSKDLHYLQADAFENVMNNVRKVKYLLSQFRSGIEKYPTP
jgi:four helix bundle protein